MRHISISIALVLDHPGNTSRYEVFEKKALSYVPPTCDRNIEGTSGTIVEEAREGSRDLSRESFEVKGPSNGEHLRNVDNIDVVKMATLQSY
jgi:hypothetical protein